MIAFLIQDRLTQDQLGVFPSRSEAEAAARRHGDTAEVVAVTDDPTIEAAWEKYHTALNEAARRAAASARAALDRHALPEGWRVVVDGHHVAVQQLRWVANPPAPFTYAHCEDFDVGRVQEWTDVPKNKLPEEVLRAYEAAVEAAAAIPFPEAPDAVYAPELFDNHRKHRPTAPDWADAANGYWLLADEARRHRLWREMRQAVEAARKAEERADPIYAAIFSDGLPELGGEALEAAQLGRRTGRERAGAARKAVLAEMDSHKERVKVRRSASRRAAQDQAREQRRREQEERAAELRAAFPIGSIVEAEQSYRLRKQNPDIVILHDLHDQTGRPGPYARLISGPLSENWDGRVRIVSHRRGRHGRKNFELEVEA